MFPLAAKAVRESFYVDDGLPSVQTKQEAILLQRQFQDLFAAGGFKLHKSDSNSTEVLNWIPQEIRCSQAISKLGDSDNFVKTLAWNTTQVEITSDFRLQIFPLIHPTSPSAAYYLIHQRSSTHLASFHASRLL